MHLHLPERTSDASRASLATQATPLAAPHGHSLPGARHLRRLLLRFVATLATMLLAMGIYDIATADKASAQAAPSTTTAAATAAGPTTTRAAQAATPTTTLAPGTPGAPTGPTATIVPGNATTPALPALNGAVTSGQRTAATPLTAGTAGAAAGATTVPPTTGVIPLNVSGQTSTYPALSFDNTGTPNTGSVAISVGDPTKPSQSVLIIVLLTLLSVAPSLLILLTSFTRIAIVLSLVRNALGLQGIPPNQVIVGLALFLSLFVMRPTLDQMNKDALQPMMKGTITQGEAYKAALVPLRTFMLKQTGSRELKMMISASKEKRPAKPEDISTATLIPAFILSELRIAFIIGFVVFIPFLVIDLVVSSSLMSMGMMMLPPVVISLPFKLLLFVMVDGWALVIRSLIKSFG